MYNNNIKKKARRLGYIILSRKHVAAEIKIKMKINFIYKRSLKVKESYNDFTEFIKNIKCYFIV